MLANPWYWKAGRSIGLAAILLAGCTATQRAATGPGETEKPAARATRWDFEQDEPGQVPEGWIVRETNPTKSLATWQVIRDDDAPAGGNVMALVKSGNYDGTYNLTIAEQTSFADLDLTVQVKAVEGVEDQGGGPIWRCQDENNYYICRFNPLEANYRVYFVKDGRRKQLNSVKVETQPGKWYTVRVTVLADHITCYLDDEKMLEVRDDTFKDAGMVGLWTKADAVTSFDDLVVRPPDQD